MSKCLCGDFTRQLFYFLSFSAFIKIKATLTPLAIFLHTFLLWGTVIFPLSHFLFSSFLASDHSRGVFWRKKHDKTKRKKVFRWWRRLGPTGLFTLNHLAFPCGAYPYQLHNFDFRDYKYSQARPRRQLGKTEVGGRGFRAICSDRLFLFFMLWLQVSQKKRKWMIVDVGLM